MLAESDVWAGVGWHRMWKLDWGAGPDPQLPLRPACLYVCCPAKLPFDYTSMEGRSRPLRNFNCTNSSLIRKAIRKP